VIFTDLSQKYTDLFLIFTDLFHNYTDKSRIFTDLLNSRLRKINQKKIPIIKERSSELFLLFRVSFPALFC